MKLKLYMDLYIRTSALIVLSHNDRGVDALTIKQKSCYIQCWSKVSHVLSYDFSVTPPPAGGGLSQIIIPKKLVS